MTAFNLKIFALVLIAGLGIGVYAILPIIRADEDVIVLTNSSGNAPESCLPNGGLVLAQNLTDLCDVVIISPATSQLIHYNGTHWVNVNPSVVFNDTTTCTNLNPTGNFIICAGGNVNLKSLIEGLCIDLTSNSTNISIANSCPEATTGSNLGANGEIVFSGEVVNDLQFKKLLAGSSISLSSNATNVIINNTSPDNTTCANVGTGSQVYKDGECNFRTLGHGSGITITNGTDVLTINNAGIISNSCLIGINCSGSDPATFNTDFVNGTGISITGSTSQTFTNTGVTSLTSANNQISLSGSTGAITLTPKYQLLCQTTLGSSNATIFCGSFTGHKTIIIQMQVLSTGGTGIEPAIRFNSDGGNNYSFRVSSNGGADATVTSTSRCNVLSSGSLIVSTNGLEANMIVYDMLSTDRKLVVGDSTNGINSSAGTAPNRNEFSCKWDNSSSLITSVTAIINTGTGSYNTNSQVTVWGYD